MLKYSVIARETPITKKMIYHANLAHVVPLSLESFGPKNCASCNIKPIQLINAIYHLEKEIIKALQEGHSVRLGDLGSFRITLSSTCSSSKEEFSEENLRGIKIRFVPSSRMRKNLCLNSPEMVLVREDECEGHEGC